MRRLSSLALMVLTLAALGVLARPHVLRMLASPDNLAVAVPAPTGELPLASLSISPAGDELLLNTLARLEQRSSVMARVRHRAAIDGRDFYGQGTYCQQGSGDRRQIKWKLDSQREGLAATLVQVSNGRYMWTDRRLPSGRHIDRVDLWQLRRKLDPTMVSSAPLAPGQAGWSPIHPDLWTSFGGLPMVLGALRESFEFTAPRLFRMGDKPVYAVVGRWRPDVLADILTTESRDPAQTPAQVIASTPLPSRLPQHVLILIGQHDAFPYMIEYRGAGKGSADLNELCQPAEAPLARLEYYDVQFDIDIDNREFLYDPPMEPEPIDNTARYLRRIDRSRRYELAREQTGELANRPESAGANAVPRSR